MHVLTFGELSGIESPRVKALADLMGPVKVQWKLSPNIHLEMWEKWVFLSALAASTCLLRASVGDIVVAGGADTITGLLAETQSVAEASSYGSRPDVLARNRALLTAAGSTLTASMLRDVERGGPVEAEHVIGDLVRRGQAAGLAVPLLKLAYLHLKAYEARCQRQAVRG
jgi:2-dehydropantoate 2-reductase